MRNSRILIYLFLVYFVFFFLFFLLSCEILFSCFHLQVKWNDFLFVSSEKTFSPLQSPVSGFAFTLSLSLSLALFLLNSRVLCVHLHHQFIPCWVSCISSAYDEKEKSEQKSQLKTNREPSSLFTQPVALSSSLFFLLLGITVVVFLLLTATHTKWSPLIKHSFVSSKIVISLPRYLTGSFLFASSGDNLFASHGTWDKKRGDNMQDATSWKHIISNSMSLWIKKTKMSPLIRYAFATNALFSLSLLLQVYQCSIEMPVSCLSRVIADH